MSKKRKRYNAEFKFQGALEAVKGLKTVNQLASEYELHPNQVSQWKRQLLEQGATIFDNDASQQQQRDLARTEAQLYEQIGRLKMEVDRLKKVPGSVEAKRMLIELNHPDLSIRRQCELLGLNRASFYYQPARTSALNLELMGLIDQQYTQTPFYGWPRMTAYLRRLGYAINTKRVRRLMQVMGLQAIYPKPHTSKPAPDHKIYPYLLRGLTITRPNQVWSSDITYVPLPGGFMYLVAIIDWFSRYVLAWQLSNTLDSYFCIQALQQAWQHGQPEIFNTDQGAQVTSLAFTGLLEAAHIRISMDGRGRALDNIFVERLWRTVKYEDIYLKDYETVPALITGLTRYFTFYNNERLHQSLGYRTPVEVHFGC